MIGENSGIVPRNRFDALFDDMRSRRSLDRAGDAFRFSEILKDKLAIPQDTTDKEDKKLLEACYDMESILIGNLLKAMRSTVGESDFFGKSIAKDIFRDMLYEEYAKLMARTDQIGISRQIYDHLREQKTV
jgi:flagellar protein FlgJ